MRPGWPGHGPGEGPRSAAFGRARTAWNGHPSVEVDVVVHDAPGQLGAGGHPKLPEHFPQVVLDRARADEQLGGDVPVRLSPAHQRGDLGLLRRELLRKPGFPPADAFAGGPQLGASPLGEGLEAHRVEHLVRGAQPLPCLPPSPLAAQPLAVQKVSTGDLRSGPGPAEQPERILVLLPGLGW